MRSLSPLLCILSWQARLRTANIRLSCTSATFRGLPEFLLLIYKYEEYWTECLCIYVMLQNVRPAVCPCCTSGRAGLTPAQSVLGHVLSYIHTTEGRMKVYAVVCWSRQRWQRRSIFQRLSLSELSGHAAYSSGGEHLGRSTASANIMLFW